MHAVRPGCRLKETHTDVQLRMHAWLSLNLMTFATERGLLGSIGRSCADGAEHVLGDRRTSPGVLDLGLSQIWLHVFSGISCRSRRMIATAEGAEGLALGVKAVNRHYKVRIDTAVPLSVCDAAHNPEQRVDHERARAGKLHKVS